MRFAKRACMKGRIAVVWSVLLWTNGIFAQEVAPDATLLSPVETSPIEGPVIAQTPSSVETGDSPVVTQTPTPPDTPGFPEAAHMLEAPDWQVTPMQTISPGDLFKTK